MDDPIQVTIRTAATGHETVALDLDDLPAFADWTLAEGKLVVAESGDESLVVRVGQQILDFFRGRRARAEAEGRQKPKEEVTVLNQMAGGQDEAPDLDGAAEIAAVLSAASAARRGGFVGVEEHSAPVSMSTQQRRYEPLDGHAEMRAWRALVAREGEAVVAPLLHGGAIPVRSALWPNVVYLVRTDQIAVLREGQQVASICLQLADGGPIWDAVANRLQLLRAGPDGEVQVWATGVAR